MRKRIALLLAIIIASAVFGGCSSGTQSTSSQNESSEPISTIGDGSSQESEAVEVDSKYGGILTYTPGVQNEQNLGYPAGDTNMLMDLNASPALESLFRLDTEGNVVEWLLERYEVSDDGLSYGFHLKPDIMFHDGSPLNAETVAWNIQMCVDNGKTQYTRVASVVAADEYTVTVQMSEPDILFLSNMAADPCGLLISRQSFEANGAEWAEKNPVGTGPFTFVRWENDVKAIYTRNENYWGIDADGNKLPYLDGIEVVYMTETAVIEAALESNEVQAWVRAGTDSLSKFSGMSGFSAEKAAVPTANHQLLACTDTDNPAAVKEVRQAVAYAIDFDAIVNGLFSLNCVNTNQCSVEGRIYYNEGITKREYNPEKAKELLAAAGYESGLELNFYSENSEMQEQMLTAMAPYLENVGIKANIQLLDSGGFFAMLTEGFSDGFLFSAYNYSPHEFGKMYSLMSDSAALKVVNFSLDDATYKLYEEARSSVTLEECAPLVHQIQEKVYGENCYIISYLTQYESVIKNAAVKDAGFYEWAGYHWTPEIAYLVS